MNSYAKNTSATHPHTNHAAAPALTLGVLSLLGSIGAFTMFGVQYNDRQQRKWSGMYLIPATIQLGLGTWGVIGGIQEIEHK